MKTKPIGICSDGHIKYALFDDGSVWSVYHGPTLDDPEYKWRWEKLVDHPGGANSFDDEDKRKKLKMRFQIKDNEVLDHQTNLIWQKDASGPMTWQEAMNYAASLGDGWRLPTRQELESLLNLERSNPVSDFPGMTSNCFWSSSSYASYTDFAWNVNFLNGYVVGDGKNNHGHVRCVRVGPSDIQPLDDLEQDFITTPQNVELLRSDLLAEIDAVLQSEPGLWVGGRLDSIKNLVQRLKNAGAIFDGYCIQCHAPRVSGEDKVCVNCQLDEAKLTINDQAIQIKDLLDQRNRLACELELMRKDLCSQKQEVERLQNKLNVDSQNFELECRKHEIEGLKKKLVRAFCEIRKQTFGSKVVFDREICEEADLQKEEDRF